MTKEERSIAMKKMHQDPSFQEKRIRALKESREGSRGIEWRSKLKVRSSKQIASLARTINNPEARMKGRKTIKRLMADPVWRAEYEKKRVKAYKKSIRINGYARTKARLDGWKIGAQKRMARAPTEAELKQRAIFRKKIHDKNRGKQKLKGRIARGEFHVSAVYCELRSPNAIVYKFRNIQEFVRNNPEMFEEQDRFFEWIDENGKLKTKCRASHGLSHVNSGSEGSWKGWTKYSNIEHFENNGKDLLNRRFAKEVK